MRTDHIVPIAETMDKVGYRAVATVGSQAFTVQVRNLDENPWERIRILSRLMPRTCLRGSYVTASLSSFDLGTPREMISLWIRRNVANGIKSFWICDYQDNIDRFRYFATDCEGGRSRGGHLPDVHLKPGTYRRTLGAGNPTHSVSKRLHRSHHDRGCVGSDHPGKDQKRLISVVERNCDGIPLEFHGHCNSGLASLCLSEAIEAGVTTVHTAVAPLANGTSLPSTENIRRMSAGSGTSRTSMTMPLGRFPRISGRSPNERNAPSECPENTICSILNIKCRAG